MNDLFRVLPDTPVNLQTLPTKGSDLLDIDREQAEDQFKAWRNELAEWQFRWYAEGKRKLLIVLQALDAGGKDGTIRNVFEGVNPQGVRVTSFKAPTSQELAHDFLWRIHAAVPAAGMWGVFNRSHYEDVLVVRVQQIVPENVWRARYAQINQFEQLLTDTGTVIMKFYLHISKDEQRERLQARLDDPTRRWKFDANDLKQRARWDDYVTAFEELFMRCSPTHAPWYVIPADQKWFRNWAIMRVLIEKLRALDPQFPQPQTGLDEIVIE